MITEIIGAVGAVASILGAWWAWTSAIKARRSASEADAARNEIRDRTILGDLSELVALERQAMSALAKYGPGSAPESTAGASIERDAQDVRTYISSLQRNRLAFGEQRPNEADRLCTKAFALLESITAAKMLENRRAAASELYVELSSFSYVLKSKADVQKLGRPHSAPP